MREITARFRAMKNIPACAMLALLATLSACGQKGPLFLPGNPSEIQTDVPPAGTTEERDDDQQGDEQLPR